jgi:hypothetical protein
MKAAPQCYSGLLGVASARIGLRIRNDEVVGSIPTSSTKSFHGMWVEVYVPVRNSLKFIAERQGDQKTKAP